MFSLDDAGSYAGLKPNGGLPDQSISFSLAYRPPYRYREMLSFLKNRAMPGVESVTDKVYARTAYIIDSKGKEFLGWTHLTHDEAKSALTVTISESLLPVYSEVLARLHQLFDLDCEPGIIYKALTSMNEIRPGISILGTRVPGSFDAFEMAVRAVLGQQITVKAAGTLAGRLVNFFRREVKTDIAGLSHLFPSPEDIIRLSDDIESNLGALGIIRSRARAILELAKVFKEASINFNSPAQPETEIKKLMAIPGIGPWTAKYIAMRTMQWTDAFLETDAGIKKALHPYSPREMLELSEAWRPWRSYATLNLWNSLQTLSGGN